MELSLFEETFLIQMTSYVSEWKFSEIVNFPFSFLKPEILAELAIQPELILCQR